ncbi:MAG: hypothetical protein KTR33_15045 [Gammaproteobacteria bacterium]|nr:hypothetical protein [Gammaproteobacteria bacterium]
MNSDKKLPPLGQRMLWADDATMIRKLIIGLAVLCAVLLLLDIVIHRHSYFSIEGWFGFYPVAGFVAFTVIVVAAKALRGLIGRDEAYYAPNAVDAEDYPPAGLDVRHQPGLAPEDNATDGEVSA